MKTTTPIIDFDPPVEVPPYGTMHLDVEGNTGTLRIYNAAGIHIESRLNCLLERRGDQVVVLWRGSKAA